MAVGIRGIDHPVIAVRNMAEAHGRFVRLGFTIPPRGSHLEWGTGNWCIMFGADYLELRGVVDASRYLHHLDTFLARREGLMGCAFAVADGDGAFAAARAAGLAPREPRVLTRRFELPEGETRPSFRLVFLDEADTPGLAGILMIQHLTPELLRRPDWLRHANTARRCAAMTSIVPDPEALAQPYARLFGAAAVARIPGGIAVADGGTGRLVFLTPAAAEAEGLGLPGVEAPAMAALDIVVESLPAAAAALAAGDIPFARGAAGLVVPAAEACGTVLRFVTD